MTPEQALQILEAVRRHATMSGADHDNARRAIQVIAEVLIKPKEDVEQ